MAEEVYHGQYGVALNILPCQHQDQFLAELHEELGQHLIRVGLHAAMRAARSPPGAEDALMPAPHPRLGHHPEAAMGVKAPQPPSGLDIAIHKPTDCHPQALHIVGSVPKLPSVVKGEPPPAQQKD